MNINSFTFTTYDNQQKKVAMGFFRSPRRRHTNKRDHNFKDCYLKPFVN